MLNLFNKILFMFCPECGSSNQSGFKFCSNCGFEIGKIHPNDGTKLNKSKESSKILDFPSEVWNKLVIKKEVVDLFIEQGTSGDLFDRAGEILSAEIIEAQKIFILSKNDIDLLIKSANTKFQYINISEADSNEEIYYFGEMIDGVKNGFGVIVKKTLIGIEGLTSKINEYNGFKTEIANDNMKFIICYSGYWIKEMKQGFGIEINEYLIEPKYIGEWGNNKKNGIGTEFYSKKEKYVGEWKNGSYDGFGIKYYDNGEKNYEGQFKNGSLNGKGYSYFYNPFGVIRLQGLFENGKLANGIEYYNDGQKKYEGTFKDENILNGIEYIDGIKKYEGDFKFDEETYTDGIWHGKGKFFYDEGDVYEGDFVDNVKTGNGKHIFVEGDVYEGDFVDGELIKGKKTLLGIALLEGDFVDGDLIKGKIRYDNGGVEEGDFVGNKLNGKGKRTNADGSFYEGDFIDGEYTGKGNRSNENISPLDPRDGAGIR